jgi:hypothetical protein
VTEHPPPDEGPEDDAVASFVASADQVYFRAVEELFVRLRGAPMLLSPADWQIASNWRRRGIPLAVVREALESVFAKRRERGATSRVNSLRYCSQAVEKAWLAVTELGRLAEAEVPASAAAKPPVGLLLERLAASLPAELPRVGDWRARVLAAGREAEEVERQLAAIDADLLRALEASLPPADRDALHRAAIAAAKRLQRRLGASELARAERRLAEVRLREHWKVPVLSLFAIPGVASGRDPVARDDGEVALESGDRASPAGPARRPGGNGEHGRG